MYTMSWGDDLCTSSVATNCETEMKNKTDSAWGLDNPAAHAGSRRRVRGYSRHPTGYRESKADSRGLSRENPTGFRVIPWQLTGNQRDIPFFVHRLCSAEPCAWLIAACGWPKRGLENPAWTIFAARKLHALYT